MKKDIYKIDKTNFEFETLGIIGIINEEQEFCWAMDLYAKPNKDDEGNTIAPKFSFTQLEQATDYKYNESFRWKEMPAYSEKLDDWIASFYIYDNHFFTADVEVIRKDRENYEVSIEGKVNLNWETAPTTDYRPFKIQTTVPFNGIICEIEDEKKAFEITKNYIDTEGLEWLPREKTSSGQNNWLSY